MSSALRPHHRHQVGLLRTELMRRGVSALEELADGVERGFEAEAAADPLAFYDVYTRDGTDVRSTLVAPSGEQTECVVFSQNVYLGLNRDPRVIAAAERAVTELGTGSGSSPGGVGRSRLHVELAARLATLLAKETAVVFPTGYSANLGGLSALPGPGDLIVLDAESHRSMFDGAKLSGARWMGFAHNDLADLERKLTLAEGRHPNVFVAVESVYSMSGDAAPVEDLVALKRAHRFYLYVDEAHSFGFYGPNGRGFCHERGVADEVDFLMGTMSKAMASVGGFIATKRKYAALIMAGAGAYFAHACMTPAAAGAALAALDIIEHDPRPADRLRENYTTMRRLLSEAGFRLGRSQGPIIPLVVPDQDVLYELAGRVRRDGIFAMAMTFPVVPADAGRLRFIVTAAHEREHIERAVASLSRHARALGLLG